MVVVVIVVIFFKIFFVLLSRRPLQKVRGYESYVKFFIRLVFFGGGGGHRKKFSNDFESTRILM